MFYYEHVIENNNMEYTYLRMAVMLDRLCGLVVRVPDYRSRVRFPALPDFLRSSGSGRGSTQPHEDN
jgi:hypothetical protein